MSEVIKQDLKTEALKLALEGLEKWHFDKDPRGADQYITAIREALAEQPAQGCEFCSHPLYAGTKCKNCGREQSVQQQEPFAYYFETYSYEGQKSSWFVACPCDGKLNGKPGIPLYTSPQPAQPSKPWVGLTDEEIHKMTVLMGINPEWKAEMEIVRSVVRNLEAKLWEKNA